MGLGKVIDLNRSEVDETIDFNTKKQVRVEYSIRTHYQMWTLLRREVHIAADDSPWSPGYSARLLVWEELWG